MYAALRSDLTFAEETERASHLRMVAVQRRCLDHYVSPGGPLPESLAIELEDCTDIWRSTTMQSAELRARLVERVLDPAVRVEKESIRLPLDDHDIERYKPRGFDAKNITLSPQKLFRPHPDPIPPGVAQNVQGIPLTDLQLRCTFDELDVGKEGILTIETVLQLYMKMENFGVPLSESKARRTIQEFARTEPGVLTFQEFAMFILKLGKR